MVIDAFISGVALCLGLVLVFGPQNLFILRTGLEGKNRFAVALTCTLCEVVLVIIGVFGLGLWLQNNNIAMIVIGVLGIGFLAYYGIDALKSAIKHDHNEHQLDNTEESKPRNRLKMAIGIAIAMSCNPSSLSDTFIIIPAIAGPFSFEGKIAFLTGHMITITFWFFSLCFASTRMRQLFKHPRAWQILDILVFLMMSYLVVKMSLSTLRYL